MSRSEIAKLKGYLHILKTLLHMSRPPSGEVLSIFVLSSLCEDCPLLPALEIEREREKHFPI